MTITPGLKRCYDEISGQRCYSAAKCQRREYHSLEHAMKRIDAAGPTEVRSIADILWRDGLLFIKNGEFKLSLELCPHITYDRLRKILCMTEHSIRKLVTQFSLLHYLHLSTEIPALLIEAFPHLDITQLRECHTLLPDHIFYIGREQVPIGVNKGVLGFNQAGMSRSSHIENVSPEHFENCLRVTVGEALHFTTENHLEEYLEFVKTLSYLHLFDAPLRVVTLFEQALSIYLVDHKEDILQSEDLCIWLNKLVKLLQPCFQSGRLHAVRKMLVREFHAAFYARMRLNCFWNMEAIEAFDKFKKLESYLLITTEEIASLKPESENPLEFMKDCISQLLCDHIRNRLFSDELVAGDIDFNELIKTPIVKDLLLNSIDKLTCHNHKELSSIHLCNLRFLYKYIQENCINPLPDLLYQKHSISLIPDSGV